MQSCHTVDESSADRLRIGPWPTLAARLRRIPTFLCIAISRSTTSRGGPSSSWWLHIRCRGGDSSSLDRCKRCRDMFCSTTHCRRFNKEVSRRPMQVSTTRTAQVPFSLLHQPRDTPHVQVTPPPRAALSAHWSFPE